MDGSWTLGKWTNVKGHNGEEFIENPDGPRLEGTRHLEDDYVSVLNMLQNIFLPENVLLLLKSTFVTFSVNFFLISSDQIFQFLFRMSELAEIFYSKITKTGILVGRVKFIAKRNK